jgi:peptidoglycan hydrolase FlgJ
MAAPIMPPPQLNVATMAALHAPATRPGPSAQTKAREAAIDFETVVLSNMFNQMFTGIEGDGPFGGGGKAGVWRSFLTEEYAKTFAKAGGIGIADHVYRSLLAQQEIKVS